MDIRELIDNEKSILTNLALNEIKLGDNNILILGFLNTYNGKPLKKMLCHNVWKMNFQTGMEMDEEFPCYITDVKLVRLKEEEIQNAFKYFNYGYNTIPNSTEYNILTVYGGDTDIDILCGKVKVIDN